MAQPGTAEHAAARRRLLERQDLARIVFDVASSTGHEGLVGRYATAGVGSGRGPRGGALREGAGR